MDDWRIYTLHEWYGVVQRENESVTLAKTVVNFEVKDQDDEWKACRSGTRGSVGVVWSYRRLTTPLYLA